MKRDVDELDFGEEDLIYIAKRLGDATRLEALFTESGVDYAVEPDEYYGGIIFRRTRTGAFFYVSPADRKKASLLMNAHGYRALEVE